MRAQAGGAGGGNDVCNVNEQRTIHYCGGDSVTIAFALIAGDDLADLQNSAIEAQNMYTITFQPILQLLEITLQNGSLS